MEGSQRPRPDQWRLGELRVTLFSILPPENTKDWWERVAGEPPHSETTNRQINAYHAEGVWESAVLTLDIQANRIDWKLSPKLVFSVEIDPLPSIGTITELGDKFLNLLVPWLGSCPPVSRIAFGAKLALQANGKSDLYSKLSSILTLDFSPSSTDFVYQINHPRTFVDQTSGWEIKVNRISKWSHFVFKMVHRAERSIPIEHESDYIMVDIDINTDAKRAEAIPPERIPEQLRRFRALAIEIIAEGNHP